MSNIVRKDNSTTILYGTDRKLARLEAKTELETRASLMRLEQIADIQTGRIQAVAYVGKQGMEAVALVSQVEQQLAQIVPLATSRLQAIADVTALGVAEVVVDTVRRVNRRCS